MDYHGLILTHEAQTVHANITVSVCCFLTVIIDDMTEDMTGHAPKHD